MNRYLGYAVLASSLLSCIGSLYNENWVAVFANITAMIGWFLYIIEQKAN